MKKVLFGAVVFLSLATTPGCGVWEGLFGGDSKPLVENGIEVCDGRPVDIRAAVLSTSCPSGNVGGGQHPCESVREGLKA